MSGYHKTSISLEPDLAQRAVERAAALGFGNSFSAYVAKLIRDDIAERGALAESPDAVRTQIKPLPGGPVHYTKRPPPKRKAG